MRNNTSQTAMIKHWMSTQPKTDYQDIHTGEYNLTQLGQDASNYFEYDVDGEGDQLCFECTLDVVDHWNLEDALMMAR